MNITEETLNGDIPVTKDELAYLANNHKSYDLTRLDVSNIICFSNLFREKETFNQDISNWDVSNGLAFSYMFHQTLFNQPIGKWNMSKAIYLNGMFSCTRFDQCLKDWNVSNVTHFNYMFEDSCFNQPIGNWNVSKGFYFTRMFARCLFDQPIGNWDVSQGKHFDFMFLESDFNQDISQWNVVDGIKFEMMFDDSNFHRKIDKWNISLDDMDSILSRNFELAVLHGYTVCGVTHNGDQLNLMFKDSPDNPFRYNPEFDLKTKTLYLIKSYDFYAFMDEEKNFCLIDQSRTTVKELIDVCDIKLTA